ncbi:MAG: MBOAT family O-acyltransferase [Acidobacteriota bacterium]
MLFTSTVFLFLFLPLLLLLYYIFPVRMRNGLLFLASLIFYAWGEVFYSCIILVSIGVNYGLARIMATVNAGGRRRILLGIAIAFNLLLLGWFKYANFLIDNLNHLLQLSGMPLIHLSPVHLPIGISFFTFQAMSYVIDAYLGKVMVQKRIMHLGLYISLFPQLIAGPIVRYSDIATEIAARHVNLNRFAYGIRRFIIGMGKKMILANPLGEVADNIFSLSPQEWTTPVAWIGIVCYTLQIYFDFSGYSDMAIGLGRMLGFTFKENFRYPYAAESIRGFWRRWHISLSTWFRDYLYVPLGGSHVCYLRTIFNLWIVFLLCGLWHGPSWNFVVWGGLHGCLISLEHTRFEQIRRWLWRPLRHAYVLLFVMVAWVFFRLETLSGALIYVGVMLGIGEGKVSSYLTFDLFTLEQRLIFIAALFSCVSWRPAADWARSLAVRMITRFKEPSRLACPAWLFTGGQILDVAILMSILILSIMHIAAGTYNPFIYFRF